MDDISASVVIGFNGGCRAQQGFSLVWSQYKETVLECEDRLLTKAWLFCSSGILLQDNLLITEVVTGPISFHARRIKYMYNL